MEIDTLLAQYGLFFVFLGCMLEGDTVAVTAGILSQQGTLDYWPTIIAAALGGWVSDLGIFGFGRFFRGNPRIARTLAHPRAIRLTRRFLGRPHVLAAIFRFIPATRTIAPLALATATPIRFPVYAAITGCACLLWSLIAVTIGADLGAIVGRIWNNTGASTRIGMAILVAVIAVYVWRRRGLQRARKSRPDMHE